MDSNEMIALAVLDEMLRLYPSTFTALKEYSWLSDTISTDELDGILGLLVIVDRFPPGTLLCCKPFRNALVARRKSAHRERNS